jgi:inner membrane protein
MMTLTHLTVSALSTAIVLGVANPIVLGAGAVAGLLPDVDVAKSPAGRILSPLSRWIEQRFPHRSFTHSLLASAIVAAASYGLANAGFISMQIANAIVIGYTAGYLADLITKSGVELFFPMPMRCVVPGNRKFRLSTGSNVEYAVLVCAIAVLVLWTNINSNGGMVAAFNDILATPRGVQDLINQQGRDSQILVEVDGVRLHDRARIRSSFVVLDQIDAHAFLVHPLNSPRELYRVSNRLDDKNQILSERITARVGKRAKVTNRSLHLNDEEIVPRLRQLEAGDSETYITGTIQVDDADETTVTPDLDLYPTIVKRDNKLEFDRCSLDRAIESIGDSWGTGNLRAKTIVTLTN